MRTASLHSPLPPGHCPPGFSNQSALFPGGAHLALFMQGKSCRSLHEICKPTVNVEVQQAAQQEPQQDLQQVQPLPMDNTQRARKAAKRAAFLLKYEGNLKEARLRHDRIDPASQRRDNLDNFLDSPEDMRALAELERKYASSLNPSKSIHSPTNKLQSARLRRGRMSIHI